MATGSGGISGPPSAPLVGTSSSSSLWVVLDFLCEEPRPRRAPRLRRDPPGVLVCAFPFSFPFVAVFFLLFVGVASSSLAESVLECDESAGGGDAESLFRLLRKSLITC